LAVPKTLAKVFSRNTDVSFLMVAPLFARAPDGYRAQKAQPLVYAEWSRPD